MYRKTLLAVTVAVLLGFTLSGCGDSSSGTSGTGGDTNTTVVENTPEMCQDGTDNDGDGSTDCDDSGCQGFVFCMAPAENNAEVCQDSHDNDGDGKTDCEDPGCAGFVFCQPPAENTAEACQDGTDNDGDGATDCDDSGCAGFVFCQPPEEDTAEACQDGTDNDGDGATDCDDPGCAGFVFCQPSLENTTTACTDGSDNDGDTFVDCEDPDCSGFSFCQPPTEDTAGACQDGRDNDRDGYVDCDDSDCVGFYFCQGQSEDTPSTCSNGVDDDGDGDIDCDDSDCWFLLLCGHYNGYGVKDPWQATWDGIERGAKTYDEAKAICESLGGRLPTVTELYRNNATSGSGALGTNANTNYLWTLIGAHSHGATAIVRLSDGNVSYSGSTTRPFRCIWPEREHNGFDDVACYGEPGSTCWNHDVWNVDSMDRPAVTYATAVNECRFYGGSIPVLADWSNFIQEGLPNPTNQWVWTANPMYWYNGGYGYAVIRWRQTNAKTWSYHNSDTGSMAGVTREYRFRCVGLNPAASIQAPSGPQCTVNCFTMTDRRSTIVTEVASSDDRRMHEAIDECMGRGGEMLTVGEWTELIHDGLYVDTTWNWSVSPLYWYSGGYGYAIIRNADLATAWSYTSGYGERSGYNTNRPYRCVWRSKRPQVPSCNPDTEVVKWDATQNAYTCATATAGTSGGNSYGGEVTDPWGNAWDGEERDATTFENAKAQCESLGGRLPTATEVWAVRASGNSIPNIGVGGSTATNYLWTMAPGYSDNSRTIVRISDGSTTYTAETSSYHYRCIWPSTKSDVLATRNCYGQPGQSGCFETSTGLIADSFDRVSVTTAAAIYECRASGGRLPTLREVIQLMHSGWGNGTNGWLWLDEPKYWYSGHYGYAVYRWSGVGTNTWNYDSNSGNVSYPHYSHRFRCVYDPKVR